MRPSLVFLICILLSASAGSQEQGDASTCSGYNKQDVPIPWDPAGTQGHKAGGYHSFSSVMTGSCTYTRSGEQNCASISYSYGSISGADTGSLSLTNPLYTHYHGQVSNAGIAQAPLGGVATVSQVTNAASVESCLLSCTVVISVSAAVSGVNASVTFPPSAIFNAGPVGNSTACPNEPDPQGSTGGGGGGSGYAGCCGSELNAVT